MLLGDILAYPGGVRNYSMFLDFVRKAPYKILSIQVDGGSEFMDEFAEACAELGIPLIVLPPKKPTYNGGVATFSLKFLQKSSTSNLK